jgi:transcription elongation GreA/GreB family factor
VSASPTDKQSLVDAVLAELQQRIDEMSDRARATAASATHSESKAEDDKDTRAIEESYLARGQAERVAQLEADHDAIRFLPLRSFADERPIAATALVQLEDEDEVSKWLFVVPRAGGLVVSWEGRKVSLVTPASPLGQALLGKVEDDEVNVVIKGSMRTWTVVSSQ